MRKQAHITSAGSRSGSPPPGDGPLDLLYQDHLREREVCALIDRLAQGLPRSNDRPASALDFLRRELPVHLRNEEEDLFPLLRLRCEAEDDIDRALSKLESDHRAIEQATARALRLLARLETNPAALDEEEQLCLLAFTTAARRHLIFENAIVLPLARARLTADDLQTLGDIFKQRREEARRA